MKHLLTLAFSLIALSAGAQIKISALPPTTAVNTTDDLIINQTGTTKRTAVQYLPFVLSQRFVDSCAAIRSAIGSSSVDSTKYATRWWVNNTYVPTPLWSNVQSKPSSFPPSAHTHTVADISATGTPSATTYLRGDGTWATPAGGGGSTDTTGFGLATRKMLIDTAAALRTAINTKQATLVSGTNIKTVNGTSLLGSGDISISGGSSEIVLLDSVEQFYTTTGDITKLYQVKDQNRTDGKLFRYKPGVFTADSGISYPSAGVGVFEMQNVGDAYYINYFGAIPDDDTSKDDSRFIQKTIDRAYADRKYKVRAKVGRYMLRNNIPTWNDESGTNPRYQISFPLEQDQGNASRMTFEGDVEGSTIIPILSIWNAPGLQNGVIFESTIHPPTRPGDGVCGAVFGSKYYFNSYSYTSFVGVKMSNITVLIASGSGTTGVQATMSGIDLEFSTQSQISNCVVSSNISPKHTVEPAPGVIGIRTPRGNNYATSMVSNCRTIGVYTGFVPDEHTYWDRHLSFACVYGLRPAGGGGHRIGGSVYHFEYCKWGIDMAQSGNGQGVYIAEVGEEHGTSTPPKWYDNLATVRTDPSYYYNLHHLEIGRYVTSGSNRFIIDGNPENIHILSTNKGDVKDGFFTTDAATAYIDGATTWNLQLFGNIADHTIGIRQMKIGQRGKIIFRQSSSGGKTLTLPASTGSITVVQAPGYSVDTTADAWTTISYYFDGKTITFSTP